MPSLVPHTRTLRTISRRECLSPPEGCRETIAGISFLFSYSALCVWIRCLDVAREIGIPHRPRCRHDDIRACITIFFEILRHRNAADADDRVRKTEFITKSLKAPRHVEAGPFDCMAADSAADALLTGKRLIPFLVDDWRRDRVDRGVSVDEATCFFHEIAQRELVKICELYNERDFPYPFLDSARDELHFRNIETQEIRRAFVRTREIRFDDFHSGIHEHLHAVRPVAHIII